MSVQPSSSNINFLFVNNYGIFDEMVLTLRLVKRTWHIMHLQGNILSFFIYVCLISVCFSLTSKAKNFEHA